jgi:peptidoglycan/xylan/chitin deacetylase (PgdA/CDA1 family)
MSKTKDEISIKRQLAASSFRYLMGTHWVPTEKWSVLMYHRILNPEDAPYPLQAGMYVRPDTFRMHLEFLSKNARVIPLTELISEVEAGERKEKKKTVAITFDDGWSDFAEHAYPLLKEFDTPASVFLPTSFIGSSRLFWTDQLALQLELLSGSEKCNTIATRIRELPSELVLRNLAATYIADKDTRSTSCLEQLLTALKSHTIDTRRSFLADMSNIAREYTTPNCPPQFMTWEQIQLFATEGLLTFGSHSHCHELLTQLTPEQCKDDITQSIQVLREKSIPMLPVFCYPNQTRNSHTDAILNEAGFTYSLGTISEDEEPGSVCPPCINRIGIHEDIASDIPRFSFRIWTSR